MLKKLLNLKEVSELLQISKRTVYRLIAQGKLPNFIKIGGSIRWKSEDINLWVENGCPRREVYDYLKKGGKK